MRSTTFAIFTVLFSIFLSQSAVAEEACDVAAVEMATTPAPAISLTGQKGAKALAENSESSADLIFVGDSLLFNWGASAAGNFPRKKIWNFSVGGDRTQNVLWRFQNTKVMPKNPSAVVILIGTNNFSDNLPACAVAKGVDAVVDRAKAAWPNAPIFNIEVLPRGADFKQFDDVRKEVNARVGTRLRDLNNTFFVDVDENEITCSGYGKGMLPSNTLACFPENAYSCGNYRKDNLHLEAGGYKILERVLKEKSSAAFEKNVFN